MLASLRTKCMARRRSVTVLSTIALLASAVAFPVTAIGNEWDPRWEVTIGRSADAVATDASGDVYVTGTVRSADGYWRSMVVAKYSADGAELWRHTWLARSSQFPYSIGRDVAVSPDGETVFVAGAELIDSTEHARAKIWAYTSDGDLRWHRAIWGSSSLVADGIGAGPAGPVVGGQSHSEYPVFGDGRVAAFGDDGSRLWTSPFEVPGVRRSAADAVFDVDVDVRGRAYVVGSVERRVVTIDEWWDGIWSDADIAVQRFDPDGRLAWSRVFADPGVKDRDVAFSVDAAGRSVAIAGERDGARNEEGKAWLALMSSGGRLDWTTFAGVRPSIAAGVVLTPWEDIQLVGGSGVGPRRLFLRAYSLDGTLESRRHLDRASASGIAASDEPALSVVGGRSLWRLPAG